MFDLILLIFGLVCAAFCARWGIKMIIAQAGHWDAFSIVSVIIEFTCAVVCAGVGVGIGIGVGAVLYIIL